MQAYVLVKCNTGSESRIISELKELPEVSEINGIWGEHDIILKTMSYDPQIIDEIVNRLRNHQILLKHTPCMYCMVKGEA